MTTWRFAPDDHNDHDDHDGSWLSGVVAVVIVVAVVHSGPSAVSRDGGAGQGIRIHIFD